MARSMNAETMPAIHTDRKTVVKTMGLLVGFPAVLSLCLIGAEVVRSYNGLVTSVTTLQQDVAQGLRELRKQNERLQISTGSNSEVKAEYIKLERQLADARALNATLEKQLAEARTLSGEPAEPIAATQPPAQDVEAPSEPQPSAQDSETPSEPAAQLSFTQRRYELGSEGSEVERIQKQLQKLGHYSGAANGAFDAETATAVQSFQTSQELEADGIAGRTTLQHLFPNAKIAVQSDSQVPAPDATTAVEPTAGIEPAPVRYTLGAKGLEVERIQKQLQELGHYQGTIDSAYGAETRKAVKSFQRSRGVRADGFIGERTWLLLFPDN